MNEPKNFALFSRQASELEAAKSKLCQEAASLETADNRTRLEDNASGIAFSCKLLRSRGAGALSMVARDVEGPKGEPLGSIISTPRDTHKVVRNGPEYTKATSKI